MTITLKRTTKHIQKAADSRVASCETDLQVFRYDKEQGDRLRYALADSGVYPTGQLEGDDGWAVKELNNRVWLPQMLEHLGRTELEAVFRLVSLLVKTPPNEEIFDYIDAKTKRFMDAHFTKEQLAEFAL